MNDARARNDALLAEFRAKGELLREKIGGASRGAALTPEQVAAIAKMKEKKAAEKAEKLRLKEEARAKKAAERQKKAEEKAAAKRARAAERANRVAREGLHVRGPRAGPRPARAAQAPRGPAGMAAATAGQLW